MELVPGPEDVLKVLRATGALRSGHFLCPSGFHTDQYLETALAMRDYRYAKILSVGLSRLLRANSELRAIIHDLSIVAASLSGVPVAYGLCEALHARQVYWTEKKEPTEPMRFRQFLEPAAGERAVLTDDVLRHGVLLREAKALLESRGVHVVAMAVLVHQPTPRTVDFASLPVYSLAKLPANYYAGPEECELCRRGMPLEHIAGGQPRRDLKHQLPEVFDGGSMNTTLLVKENLNPFEISQAQFEVAADLLHLEEGMRAILRTPKRQLIVSIPVRMDDGDIQVFEGYRVRYNLTRGRPKAGFAIILTSLWMRSRHWPLG